MKRESWREGAVGWCLVGGAALIVLGSIGTFLFATSSVHTATASRNPSTGAPGDMGWGTAIPLALLTIFAGVCLIAGALGYGLLSTRSENVGNRREVAGAVVIARYALTPDGIYMTDPIDIEHADGPKFYVRLGLPGEETGEFNTSEETFWWAGEGMRGTAEVAGKWLGRFTPDLGASAGTGHVSTIV